MIERCWLPLKTLSSQGFHGALLRCLITGPDTGRVKHRDVLSCPPAGFRFPRDVIAVAVRWYLRYGLSYRDVEELLAERGVAVDHVSVYRWVQRFTPEFIEAARPARLAPGDRWFVDETYLKDCRPLDLSVPSGRPARSGRRCVAQRAPRPNRSATVLHPGAARWHRPGRGHHRPGTGVPAGLGRAGPVGDAHRGAVREQPDRM